MKKANQKITAVIDSISKRVAKLKAKAHRITKRNREEIEDIAIPQVKMDPGMKMMMLEISPMTVFRTMLVIFSLLLAAYVFYQIGGILILFFMAFFIAAALDPLIDFLQAKRFPRAIGIILIYLILFLLVAILISALLPLIAQQLFSLAGTVNDFILKLSQTPTTNLPFGPQIKPYLDEIYRAVDIKVVAVQFQNSLQLISAQLFSLGGNLWSIILQVSNGLFNFILILILVFFMTVDEMAIENFCVGIFPTRFTPYITQRLQMVKVKIGEWIRGQLMVSIVAAIISFIGLAIAGVQYSLLIAVITGICMIVPVFGRVVAAVLVLPIVLNQSLALAIFLIIYYFAISQVENNILVPLLMNKAVGLSPIIIIFALLIGFQFLGILGLILAIPMATIVAVFAKDLGKRIHAKI